MRESKSRALPLGYTPMGKRKGRSRCSGPFLYGVGNGARTHDPRNHNPMLCQLSYTHHLRALNDMRRSEKFGTPEGTRTPDPLLRRQLLYPPELQAHMERVMGIEPTRPAWKAGILPLNYTRKCRHSSVMLKDFIILNLWCQTFLRCFFDKNNFFVKFPLFKPFH